MSRSGEKFDRPPIVETVLGVQFAPLHGMTAAHLGWFWKRFLGPEWDSATNAAPLADQFERFGDQMRWESLSNLRLMLNDGSATGRIRLTRDQGERMLQVQPTRFLFNWQRRDNVYPHYDPLKAAFEGHFGEFTAFVTEAGIGPLEPNQWEVTYVDHIVKGELWETADDWHRVIPGLFPPPTTLELSRLEGVGGEWHYEIRPEKGRLHIAAASVRLGENGQFALQLKFTARGPVNKQMTLAAGLDLGHDAILDAFMKITSPAAHEAWGIRR